MTKFIEWSDDLSVGIEEIDEQHKILLGLVNKMHDAIQHRQGNDIVADILASLADYTRIHFAVEESLMRILHYPAYEEHRKTHEMLENQLHDLQKKMKAGSASIGFELMHFLKVWLTKHIMEDDRSYSGFFLDAGMKPKMKKKSWASLIWRR
jgi:hemerythrin